MKIDWNASKILKILTIEKVEKCRMRRKNTKNVDKKCERKMMQTCRKIDVCWQTNLKNWLKIHVHKLIRISKY